VSDPYYARPGVALYCGSALDVLRALPDRSVNCVVTSPPYWQLRDYQTATWEGGDPACDHQASSRQGRTGQRASRTFTANVPYLDTCGKCGARRVDRQLGLEATPEEYAASLVAIFREVRRVLCDDGTVWLNLGDSFAGSAKGTKADGTFSEYSGTKQATNQGTRTGSLTPTPVPTGCKPRDLVGIPWLVAFALRADGWYLRSDVIWAKGNPMPESVTNRPTRSHEYLFLLTKSMRYWYDGAAIAEPVADSTTKRLNQPTFAQQEGGAKDYANGVAPNRSARKTVENLKRKQDALGKRTYTGFNDRWHDAPTMKRNKRDVWLVNTQATPFAHFATMPEKLVAPCILAGCPPAGRRCDCDATILTPQGNGNGDDPTIITGRAGMNRPRGTDEGTRPITRREQRWHARELRESPHRAAMEERCGPAFEHYIRTDESGARPLPESIRQEFLAAGWLTEPPPCDHPVEPAGVVLDPFAGSGTTGRVATRLGRQFIGIELNPDYCALAAQRLQQGSLFLDLEESDDDDEYS
jgi:DNA modification methylase